MTKVLPFPGVILTPREIEPPEPPRPPGPTVTSTPCPICAAPVRSDDFEVLGCTRCHAQYHAPFRPSSAPYTVGAPRVRERKREPTSWDMGTIECKRSRDAPYYGRGGACRPEDRSTLEAIEEEEPRADRRHLRSGERPDRCPAGYYRIGLRRAAAAARGFMSNDSRRRRVCREHTPSPSAFSESTVYFFGGETLMSFVTLTTPSVSFASRSASALACSFGTVPFR